jgi:hypothetical protein
MLKLQLKQAQEYNLWLHKLYNKFKKLNLNHKNKLNPRKDNLIATAN